jgi:hypothetical protein
MLLGGMMKKEVRVELLHLHVTEGNISIVRD